jgi:hypothetical protein
MALKEHSGSRESKPAMGVWLLHATQAMCHPPDHLHPVASITMLLGLLVLMLVLLPLQQPMMMLQGQEKQVATQWKRDQKRAKWSQNTWPGLLAAMLMLMPSSVTLKIVLSLVCQMSPELNV